MSKVMQGLIQADAAELAPLNWNVRPRMPLHIRTDDAVRCPMRTREEQFRNLHGL